MFAEFKNEATLKKLLSLGILILIGYLLKDMVNLILLTFLFAFCLYGIQNYLFQKMRKLNLNRTEITLSLYVLIIIFIGLILSKYLPIIIKELLSIGFQLSHFKLDVFEGIIDPRILNMIEPVTQSYTKNGGALILQTASNIWSFSLNILIAFILSLFFVLEREPLLAFIQSLEKSRIGFAIAFYRRIGSSFLQSFGKVIQVQIQIAFINSILSTISLFFLGFPQVLGLGSMIFFLGLVPVAGVMISFIPLSIIAYNHGGFIEIIYVIILIIILHALESYVLNPKLMSMKTKLPVFLTFIILIISEHFFKVWGLLFGLPLFIFLMDLLKVKTSEDDHTEH